MNSSNPIILGSLISMINKSFLTEHWDLTGVPVWPSPGMSDWCSSECSIQTYWQRVYKLYHRDPQGIPTSASLPPNHTGNWKTMDDTLFYSVTLKELHYLVMYLHEW